MYACNQIIIWTSDRKSSKSSLKSLFVWKSVFVQFPKLYQKILFSPFGLNPLDDFHLVFIEEFFLFQVILLDSFRVEGKHDGKQFNYFEQILVWKGFYVVGFDIFDESFEEDFIIELMGRNLFEKGRKVELWFGKFV